MSRFGALVLYKLPVHYPVVFRLVFVRNLATLDFALGVPPPLLVNPLLSDLTKVDLPRSLDAVL